MKPFGAVARAGSRIWENEREFLYKTLTLDQQGRKERFIKDITECSDQPFSGLAREVGGRKKEHEFLYKP